MMSRGRYLHYRQSERLLSFGKAERFVAAVATVPAVDERVALRTLVSQPCPPWAAGPKYEHVGKSQWVLYDDDQSHDLPPHP
jgi:hypothetical protein